MIDMKRDELIVFISAILILVFSLEIIAPMLLRSNESTNKTTYTQNDITLATYIGPLQLISTSESLLIINADQDLKDNLSKMKNEFNILYIGEDINGVIVILRDPQSTIKLSTVIPKKYDVRLSSFFELSNGTEFISSTNEKIKLNSTTAFKLLLNRDYIDDALEYKIEAYLTRNTGEFLSLSGDPEPIEKTEFKEIEIVISQPLLAIFDYSKTRDAFDNFKLTLPNSTNLSNNYVIDSELLKIYLNNSDVKMLVSEFMATHSLTTDLFVQANYSGSQYLLLLKAQDKILEPGVNYRVNATVVHIGKKLVKITV